MDKRLPYFNAVVPLKNHNLKDETGLHMTPSFLFRRHLRLISVSNVTPAEKGGVSVQILY